MYVPGLLPTGHLTIFLKPCCTYIVLVQLISFEFIVLSFNEKLEPDWEGKVITGANNITLC